MWLYSAYKGFKGLDTISKFGVPAALFFTIYSIYNVWASEGGFQSVFSYVPENPISFTAATAATVGGWIIALRLHRMFAVLQCGKHMS